ncbi:response regulator transcription factor [Intestinimonas butyriciproducens]|uniref:response regulator transcription factor n=1 Tax=Intestinimonas butyriciproducens TaxID=1297617 RepID=UPI0018AC8B88|nr:response regulator transcription factor [Intestinimonas butyriciproducens]MDB7816564.1 response regulator transcription factor [Intestinimonas butyriciproducens]MDB7842666.1 response regulator transcription factor [Intestinimonas butyriciproducens]MDB7857586.1 response regulator transcription factor [Intestinimonas butyriciproducens]
MRILMVEDDQALCAAVDIHLRQQGYTVDYAHTGEDGLHFALQNAYDLILMDRMLPELDGLEAVRTLRSRGFSTSVLMLTALDGVPDRVDGLDAGADDYLAKPFAAEELLARIRALSRRPRQWESTSRLSAGDLELDTELAALRGPAGACSLSRREKQLLELFLRNAGQTLTRELLLSRVWGPDAPVEDGNLDNYIHFLRRRLRTVGSAVRLATVRSVGYRLEVGPC